VVTLYTIANQQSTGKQRDVASEKRTGWGNGRFTHIAHC